MRLVGTNTSNLTSGTTGNAISMAGPEDSTSTSSQHHHHHHRHHHQGSGSGHGQNPDPFRLPGDDVVSDQDSELADRLLDNPKHQGTVGDFYEESSTDTATASTMRPGNDNLRIDFRNGNGIKRTSIEQPGQSGLQTSHSGAEEDSGFSEAHASEQSERKFSTRSIQSDDDSVFGLADTHDHLFFIEADDEDDDNDNDNDNELEHNRDEEDYDDHSEADDEFSAKYYEDDVSDDDFDNENRTQNLNTQPFPHTTSTDSQSTDLKDNAEEHSQDSSNQPGSGGLKRSPPRPILRRSSTSNMYTMCRQSHSSGLMVRCQMNRADPMTAASCPPFFCPLWTNLVPLRSVAMERGATASGGASQTSERRRRYTVGSKTDQQQQQQQQQQQGQPGRRHAMQDDPRRPGFVGRGRSYSDSDVQRLLIVEVGQELRRISDEFNLFHVKKGKLTTVSESTSEEDFGPEV